MPTATRIRDNALALGVPNLEIVEGKRRVCWQSWILLMPFYWGGLSTTDMFETCWNNLKPGGRLVANSVTFEGEKLLMGGQKPQGELTRFDISMAALSAPLRAGTRPSR